MWQYNCYSNSNGDQSKQIKVKINDLSPKKNPTPWNEKPRKTNKNT